MPWGLVAADFNGDGNLDLVTSNYGMSLEVLLGNGNGMFQAAATYPLNSDMNPVVLAVGDFNGDGKLDIAAATEDGLIRIMTGGGDGSFQQTATYPSSAGSNPYPFAVGDFNGDGRADLAIANPSGGKVTILLGASVSLAEAGTPQTTVAGTAFAAPLQVTAMEGAVPVPGVLVTFATPTSGAGATLSSTTATTNASGVASVVATANSTLGSFTISASAGPLTDFFALTNALGGPASVTPVTAAQSTAVGTAFAKALSVTVKDAGGNPLSNVTVTFATPSSGASASLSSTTAVTNASGVAGVTATANGLVGSYAATAAVGPVTATFSLTNQAASSVMLSAAPVTSTYGTPVVLTATVTPASATGKVTFWDGVNMVGAGVVSSGVATYATHLLPAGIRQLRAYYSGSGGMAGSGSNTAAAAVNTAAASIFEAGGTATAGSNARAVVTADFNGDGKADMAVVNSQSNNISVLLGNGDGTFWSALTYAAGDSPYAIATGDFNGDGITDLVVADYSDITVLIGNGDGTFQPPGSYATFERALAVVVADFNGDGIADIATGGSIFLGNGDGTFQAALAYNAGQPAYAMAAGDFNGDGKTDLVVGTSGTSLEVFIGNGDGTFKAPVSYNCGYLPLSIVVADFNGDGKLDIASPGNYWGGLYVLLGNGDGTFQGANIIALTSSNPSGLVQGDFNGDGKTDLAVLGQNMVTILLGTGTGSFQAGINYSVAGNNALAVADFNGDGRADLAAVNGNNTPGTVSVLLGVTATISAGGTPQTAPLNTAFGSPLQVTVMAGSTPVPGVTVNFAVPISGASATLNGPVVTNASGVAAVTATANGTAGSYAVSASVGPLTLNFALTNSAGGPASLTPGNATQSTAVGAAFAKPLQVTVKDSIGHLLSGVTVSFSPSSYYYGASATLSSATAITNALGVASVTGTANTYSGQYTVTATVGSLTANFSLTNLWASQLTLSASPNPSTFGALVTLTASLTSGFTGKVTFYDGVTVLGTKAPVSGTASISTILLPAGSRKLRAYYSGDANYAPSVSSVYAQTVNAAAPLGFALCTTLAGLSGAVLDGALVGDFNGDGKADLAIGRANAGGTVDIYLGNGNGTFQRPSSYFAGDGPFLLGMADFNGDGYQDIAIVDSLGAGVNILLGYGDGTFRTPWSPSISWGSLPSRLAIADFNGDGAADIALTNSLNRDISIWLGNGDGTFRMAADYSLGINSSPVVAGDFNGDGIPDLAVGAEAGSTALDILLGNGDGTFRVSSFSTGGAQALAAADFNSDGKLDLATPLGILPGNGDGTFGALIAYPSVLSTNWIIAGDFNGDGMIDIASPNRSGGALGVFFGNGDGTFQASLNFTTGSGPYATVAADFNGDGRPDFAVVNADRSVSILLGGTSASAAPATLSITKTHAGNFTQGQNGAVYTVTASNRAVSSPTNGTVTVTETLPSGLTMVSMAGTGWTCAGAACTRTDALAAGASYPPIAVTVNVAANAASPQVNSVSVSGGGSASATASDSTAVNSSVTALASLTAGSPTAAPGGAFSIPVTLALNSGVSVGAITFGIQITPNGGAPPLTGALSFAKDSSIADTPYFSATSNSVSVLWSSLTAAFSGTRVLGTVSGAVPATAATAQSYTIVVTGASADSGGPGTVTIPISAGPNGALKVNASYLVGDVAPYTSDTAPKFGDGALNIMDLVQVLFAVNNVPGFRPAACSDRFDAMDSYPPDTAPTRGGDGILDIRDLVQELFRVNNLDTSRPVRAAMGGALPWAPCASGSSGNSIAPAEVSRESVASPALVSAARGALAFGPPEQSGETEERAPVYLEARRDLAHVAVTFALGDQHSQLRFVPTAETPPSLAQDSQLGVVAAAWLGGVSVQAGNRLLLGYVAGPAGAVANLQVYGLSASGLDDNGRVLLAAPSTAGLAR
jgi:hypothetical protein